MRGHLAHVNSTRGSTPRLLEARRYAQHGAPAIAAGDQAKRFRQCSEHISGSSAVFRQNAE